MTEVTKLRVNKTLPFQYINSKFFQANTVVKIILNVIYCNYEYECGIIMSNLKSGRK